MAEDMGELTKMKVLGICGQARTGKDSVADFIETEVGAENLLRLRFAEDLKRFCREVYDWTEEHTDGKLKDVPDTRYPRVGFHVWTREAADGSWFQCDCGTRVHASETVPPGECITYLTPREAMQRLGTEWARACYVNTWVDLTIRKAKTWLAEGDDRVVLVTDCRYINEAQGILSSGGMVLQTTRPGHDSGLSEKARQHPSETVMMTPEFQALVTHHLVNEGTLEDLGLKVRRVLRPESELEVQGQARIPGV